VQTPQPANIQLQVPTADSQMAHIMSVHPLFLPYCKSGNIIRSNGSKLSVQMLRDTGAMQSLLRRSSCDESDYSFTGESRILKGICKQTITVPLVEVQLQCDFMNENVLCGLVEELPEGIDFLIGNDLWLKAHLMSDAEVELAVVTRAQAKQQAHDVDQDLNQNKAQVLIPETSIEPSVTLSHRDSRDVSSVVNRQELIALQKADKSLKALVDEAIVPPFPVGRPYFFLQDGLLMHHVVVRKRDLASDRIVVPIVLRGHLLKLAHDIPAASHLGISKTKSRLEPHFFWPRMVKDITDYCRSCDKCQREGKGPKPHPAPLIPLPLITEPFSRIAIDIVGPLPVCPTSGNRFILTCVDMATHYPEAIPLQSHTAQDVTRA
jgi:hypothetical protein